MVMRGMETRDLIREELRAEQIMTSGDTPRPGVLVEDAETAQPVVKLAETRNGAFAIDWPAALAELENLGLHKRPLLAHGLFDRRADKSFHELTRRVLRP